MPLLIGHFRPVALLLLALSALASFFYFSVWSSIVDGDSPFSSSSSKPSFLEQQQKQRARVGGRQRPDLIIEHEHHQTQNEVYIEGSTVLKRPLPIPVSELPPLEDSTTTPENAKLLVDLQSVDRSLLTNAQRKRLKVLKALEREERRRKKEEQRLRKARKLERQRQLEAEPFPALISTNNARVAVLNTQAFVTFCHPQKQVQTPRQEEQDSTLAVGEEVKITEDAKPAQDKEEDENGQSMQRKPTKDVEFATYAEWMEFIYNKNTGHEQQIPVSATDTLNSSLSSPESKDMEHRYLVPSYESREMMYRRRPKHREWLSDPEMEGLTVAISEHPEVIDDSENEYDNDDDEDDDEEEAEENNNQGTPPPPQPIAPKTMDFHIFWRGPISDKLSLAAHAFLFTQPLDRSRLHLWIDSSDLPGGQPENYWKNPFARDLISDPIRQFVKIHAWNQTDQESYAYPASPTSPELEKEDKAPQAEGIMTLTVNNVVPPVALSDEARFLILHRFGGMYLDADVLLLKDMSPFYDVGIEFAYEWSNTEMYNTAVLRMNRGSSVAKQILEAAKAKQRQVLEKLTGKAIKQHRHQQQEHHHSAAETEQARTGHLELPANDLLQQQQHHHHHRHLTQDSESKSLQEQLRLTEKNQAAGGVNDLLFEPSPPPPPPTLSAITPHRLVKRGEMRPNEVFHPARLRSYLRPVDQSLENNGLTMLPVAIFDPLWLRVDHADLHSHNPSSSTATSSVNAKHKSESESEGVKKQQQGRKDQELMMEDLYSFPDAFSDTALAVCPKHHHQYQERQAQGHDQEEVEEDFSAGPEVFFMGAYAYHWHNNWHSKIESKSWMGLMRRAYDEFLAGERPNLTDQLGQARLVSQSGVAKSTTLWTFLRIFGDVFCVTIGGTFIQGSSSKADASQYAQNIATIASFRISKDRY
ncbi:hypothetical protein BGZ83_009648 [Gryganskiella cystojenkinii]|nr:hypothetical protein BGZ83_009648 [Gryganskiella cystojenkinii]